MLIDGIELMEGSEARNLTVARGTTYPEDASEGELFYNDSLPSLCVFKSGTWVEIGAVRTVAGRAGDVVLAVEDVERALSSDLLNVPNGIPTLNALGFVPDEQLNTYNKTQIDEMVAAGFPIHCFLNTGIVGENNVATNETISLPRTKAGNTGIAQYGEVSSVFGKTLYTTPWSMKDMLPNAVSLWSGKDWAVSLYAQDGTPTNPSVRGRIQGLKAFTQTRLNFMDRIQVPCDGRLNYDPTGTMTDHFVIPGGKQGAGLYTVRFLIPA